MKPADGGRPSKKILPMKGVHWLRAIQEDGGAPPKKSLPMEGVKRLRAILIHTLSLRRLLHLHIGASGLLLSGMSSFRETSVAQLRVVLAFFSSYHASPD